MLDIKQDTKIYESLSKWLDEPIFVAVIQKEAKNSIKNRLFRWRDTTQWLRKPLSLQIEE